MTTRARSTAGGISEAAFQKQVEGIARFYGWRIYHAPDNRPTGPGRRVQSVTPGFPDLTLVRDTELIFAELKRDSTYPTQAQRDWIADLARIGTAVDALRTLAADAGALTPPEKQTRIEAVVWRPRDWDDIQDRLARYRARVPATFDPRI